MALAKVYVKFKDSTKNYFTSVNPESTDKSLRDYFVGAELNVGVYPKDDLAEVIDIEVFRPHPSGIHTDITFPVDNRPDFKKYVILVNGEIALDYQKKPMYFDSRADADRVTIARRHVRKLDGMHVNDSN